MCISSLVPRPKEEEDEEEKFERAWFQPFIHVLNYLEFNHMLISGGGANDA